MTTRRRFIRILPFASLAGLGALAACGDKPTEVPMTPAPMPAPAEVPAAPPAPAMEAAPAPAPADTAGLPLVDPQDSLAQTLAYVALASSVDKTKHPQYADGQNCANCALYGAAADAPQGPCPLFPGRQVLAGAWCASYVRKG